MKAIICMKNPESSLDSFKLETIGLQTWRQKLKKVCSLSENIPCKKLGFQNKVLFNLVHFPFVNGSKDFDIFDSNFVHSQWILLQYGEVSQLPTMMSSVPMIIAAFLLMASIP